MTALHRHATLALAICLAAAAPCLSQAAPVEVAGTTGAAQKPKPLPLAVVAVGPAQGLKLIEDLGKDLVILDVRTAQEFGHGHIPGAINVPVADIEADTDRMGEIPVGRPTLIVCRAGGRAARAYKVLINTRPGMAEKGLWYLDAVVEYGKDGTYAFKHL